MSTPTVSTRRLAPDLARGAMLLLIAMAYATVYAGGGFGSDVSAASGTPLRDRVATVASTLLLDNRAFPMFAVLFGAGLAWSVARQRAGGVDDAHIHRTLRRRGAFLLLFGAVHAFLVFPGEILASYGLATLVVGWLLFRPDRTIVRAAVVSGACYVVLVPLVAVALAAGTAAAGGTSEFALPGYLTVGDWVGRLVNVPVSPLFIAVGYPLLLLVVLGFLIGRAGLIDEPARHRRVLTRAAILGIAVSLLGATPAALTGLGALTPGPVVGGLLNGLQILTGVAGGVGYAAVFALLGLRLESDPGPVARAVASVGARSLTFYLLNSVLVAVLLHPDLVGLGAVVGTAGALGVATLVWIVALLLGRALDAAGRPGPADALMRRLVAGAR